MAQRYMYIRRRDCEKDTGNPPRSWQWILSDVPGGHEEDDYVELRADDRAFHDLWELDQTKWRDLAASGPDELERYLRPISKWLACRGLPHIAERLRRQAVLQLSGPEDMWRMTQLPWMLADLGEGPLALRGITCVQRPLRPPEPRRVRSASSKALRILAVFAQPVTAEPLDLRAERIMMARLPDLGARHGRSVEVHTLQYGVTRRALRQALNQGDGWDVVHFSAHGEPGALHLEDPDGGVDPIGAQDLTELLADTYDTLKLVTLSSCWSAADSSDSAGSRSAVASAAAPDAGSLAAVIAQELGCDTVGMRFPMGDAFTRTFNLALYHSMISDEQDVGRAVGSALTAVMEDPGLPEHRYPLTVAGVHTVMSASSEPVRLTPPPYRWIAQDSGEIDLFATAPPESAHFVGRCGEMAKAAHVLGEVSLGRTGVVLHGEPGVGTTACANELARTRRRFFRNILWFEVQDDSHSVLSLAEAINGLELRVELPTAPTTAPDVWARACARLREVWSRNYGLLVLDRLDRQLLEPGLWRHPFWEALLSSLTDHQGDSRVLITSRTDFGPEPLRRLLPIHVERLTDKESLLLARQLPNLTPLLDDAQADEADHRLADDVLRRAAGLPALLMEAEERAADREELAQWPRG
ncbi:CHAT domain-containing protein [Wenjunlia tyrosinilytica]|uniref:CHAT domain-containing protein n=1 Tax=Wenjunlia tyrosinilytica TaxID=1544741 RepID=A0A917ZLH2_9ACTN|nr:CHAT domain-containing protein [Wenjunlia tyrosinilytica]GGO84171.1 hypothetical protein GCM10012280_15030 [Wenjunlia tyrosinilytica]